MVIPRVITFLYLCLNGEFVLSIPQMVTRVYNLK